MFLLSKRPTLARARLEPRAPSVCSCGCATKKHHTFSPVPRTMLADTHKQSSSNMANIVRWNGNLSLIVIDNAHMYLCGSRSFACTDSSDITATKAHRHRQRLIIIGVEKWANYLFLLLLRTAFTLVVVHSVIFGERALFAAPPAGHAECEERIDRLIDSYNE